MNPLAKRLQYRLRFQDEDVRRWYSTLLERTGAASVAELHGLLEHGSPEQRLDAIELLGHLGDRRWSARRLLALVEHASDETMRWESAQALINLGSSSNRSALARLLSGHAESEVRKVAAYVLGFMAGPIRRTEVDALIEKVVEQDEDLEVRCYAAEALGHMLGQHQHDRYAIPALTESLNDPAPEIRFWAAFALGNIGRREAIPALERITADATSVPGWWSVGKEATEAIESIERLSALR